MGYITIANEQGRKGIINKDNILAVMEGTFGGEPCVYIYLNNESCREVRASNTLEEIISQL